MGSQKNSSLPCAAGSQFRNPGLFEVTKATKAEDGTEPSTSEDGAMEVNIASDLEGAAQISVAIVESGEQVELATASGNHNRTSELKVLDSLVAIFHRLVHTSWSDSQQNKRFDVTDIVCRNSSFKVRRFGL